jgi:hypothetical protein
LLGFALANGNADGKEQDDIARLNAAILTELGLAWDRPAVLIAQGKRPIESAPIVDAVIARRYADKAAAALRSAFGDANRIVIDDQRIALFPALWDAALRELAFAPRRVLLVNNPIQVAEWLHRHRQLARPRALQLWLRDTLAALGSVTGAPDAVVTPAALRQDKSRFIVDVMARLGLAAPQPADQADAIDAYLGDRLAEPPLPSDVLFRRPLISALMKDAYRLCLDWHERDPASRADTIKDLQARFEEFCLNASAFAPVPDAVLSAPMPAVSSTTAAGPARAAHGKRHVIIHYHLFKNAGTSVDAILKRNFGARWIAQEYQPQPAATMAASVRSLLLERPDITAVSSHTLLLPLPEVPGVEIFPIIFIRHPIDRLHSAYTFEREQQSDTEGARLAKETDFAGYLRARLEKPRERFCRNAQTFRLAMAIPPDGRPELDRALQAFETLPFVGSVEAFGASVAALQRLLAGPFPGFHAFEAFENVTRPQQRLDHRLSGIRAEIGDELFETLGDANADDLALYHRSLNRYDQSPATDSAVDNKAGDRLPALTDMSAR